MRRPGSPARTWRSSSTSESWRTLLGYIGWNIGLRGLGPTRAVAFTYAISPLAVLFGAIFLDEPVTVWLAVGAALVVGGIALTQRRARPSCLG